MTALVPVSAPLVVGAPSVPLTLLRALRQAAKPQGALPAGRAVPGLVVVRPGVRPEPARVDAFARVVGLPPGPHLPPTLPEALAFPVLFGIMAHPDFPLSPFGLIHVGQTLRQPAPLPRDAPLDIRGTLAAVEADERGVTATVRLTATVEGRVAWWGDTVLFSRSRATRARAREAREGSPAPEGVPIDAPADTGRAYARVSDDWNPHHLWPWSARLFGYRRPIAHGMWSLARCLAALRPEGPLFVDARFKLPLLLPGAARLQAEGDAFSLLDARTGGPIVTGRFLAASPPPAP